VSGGDSYWKISQFTSDLQWFHFEKCNSGNFCVSFICYCKEYGTYSLQLISHYMSNMLKINPYTLRRIKWSKVSVSQKYMNKNNNFNMVPKLDFHHSVRNEQPHSVFMFDYFSGHIITWRRSTHTHSNGRFLTLTVYTSGYLSYLHFYFRQDSCRHFL
jgi:hypothetical protein